MNEHTQQDGVLDLAKIKPNERETIFAFLEILRRRLVISDEGASEPIQNFMDCINLLAEGEADFSRLVMWFATHTVKQDSDKDREQVDPSYVDYAFQQISQEKTGPKPTRFSKLRKAFKGKENESISLDDLATVYADHANPRAYTQTAIFDANQAFIKHNLQLEIQSVSIKSRHSYETEYRLHSANLG